MKKYYKGKSPPHVLTPFFFIGTEYRAKSVVTLHDTYFKWNNSWLIRLTSKIVRKYASFSNVISISEQTKEELIKDGYREENFTVIYHYIDPVFKKIEGIDKEEKTVLNVGDWTHNNNSIVNKAIKRK
ncbi:glycosyltransferase [Thermogymnomonas acidicola]|uniref:glycosyltransferase n=1 Tax=Thermogymnomonas acidicola TaxID=399579 RepID=UPI001396BF97|nr:glycosyltransferase [Thermogymnomonas acidicola]